MATTIYHIFDKMFKRILTLSSKAVINLINGLFETSYPEDSVITYNWTEFEDDELRKILADTIITINGTSTYHLEAQMENDSDIVFRVFDYGFQHANRNRTSVDGYYVLNLPKPKIIYLYSSTNVPEKYTLRLVCEDQGYFDYEVSTFNFLTTSLEELNQKKLIILIPFQLLKLRNLLEKTRTPETIKQLHVLIENDILNSIQVNLTAGNINRHDSRMLEHLAQKLLNHLYSKYPETEEICNMYDQSFNDPIMDMLGELQEQEDRLIKVNKELQVKEAVLQEKDAELQEKDAELQEKDAELAKLRAELELLKTK